MIVFLQFIRILHLEVVQQRLIVVLRGEKTETYPISASFHTNSRVKVAFLADIGKKYGIFIFSLALLRMVQPI